MARILSIEDDPDFQHILGTSLRPHGYEVHYAFNGQEGFEKVLALDPDLVILDLNLPGMNGIEVIREMQANHATKKIPILVTTAYNDSANMLGHSIKALGALEFLPKPIHMKDLVARLKAILSGRHKPASSSKHLSKGAIRADPRFRTVWIDEKLTATLSPKRFLLLKLLIEEEGPVAKSRLKEKIWTRPVSDNALEKAIQRLREDLGPANSRRLQTTLEGYELVG